MFVVDRRGPNRYHAALEALGIELSRGVAEIATADDVVALEHCPSLRPVSYIATRPGTLVPRLTTASRSA